MHTDRIGRITTDGEVSEVPLGTTGAMPSAIAAGADGALWYTLNRSDEIAHVTVDGHVTRFILPSAGAAPVGITAGNGDDLWFVEIGAGRVGRITTDGRIEEHPLADPAARPHAIVADGHISADGRISGEGGGCWFTEWGANRIGHLSPDGQLVEHALPRPDAEPHGLTIGPDGALYVALEIGSVARLGPAASGGPPPPT